MCCRVLVIGYNAPYRRLIIILIMILLSCYYGWRLISFSCSFSSTCHVILRNEGIYIHVLARSLIWCVPLLLVCHLLMPPGKTLGICFQRSHSCLSYVLYSLIICRMSGILHIQGMSEPHILAFAMLSLFGMGEPPLYFTIRTFQGSSSASANMTETGT